MTRDLTQVECEGDCRLLLTFDNGERREVNVGELILFDGVFEPLKDPDCFRQVRIEPDVGTIVWPNGADLCPDVLYEKSRPWRGAPTSKRV